MKNQLLFYAFMTSFINPAFAQSPLGGMGANMGRSAQTLNQVDQSQDGKISRNQGYHTEVDKPSLNESYNDDAHREYVKKRKMKKKKQEQY